MRMRVSDRTALWVGRITLATVIGCIAFPILALLLSSEMPWLLNGGTLFWVLGAGVFIAWSVAHFVMVWHQDAAGYVSRDDVAEWEAREDSKFGGLVPFAYLLASPEQRRVLQYLGHEGPPEKPRHWYSRRFWKW